MDEVASFVRGVGWLMGLAGRRLLGRGETRGGEGNGEMGKEFAKGWLCRNGSIMCLEGDGGVEA